MERFYDDCFTIASFFIALMRSSSTCSCKFRLEMDFIMPWADNQAITVKSWECYDEIFKSNSSLITQKSPVKTSDFLQNVTTVFTSSAAAWSYLLPQMDSSRSRISLNYAPLLKVDFGSWSHSRLLDICLTVVKKAYFKVDFTQL